MSDDHALRVERMSDADALMWNIEKDPLLRSTITAVSLLDRAPDQDRLGATGSERGTRLIPGCASERGRPSRSRPPRWVVDPNFDLSYHLRTIRAPGGVTALAARPGRADRHAGLRPRPAAVGVHVVEGLADGKAALIQKIHHSITDGVGGVKLAMMLLDLEKRAGRPGPHARRARRRARLTSGALTLEALRHERRRQLGIARRSVGSATRAARPPGRPTSARIAASWPRRPVGSSHLAPPPAQPGDDRALASP